MEGDRGKAGHYSEISNSQSVVIPPEATLKTAMSLRKNPAVLRKPPFYLMKDPPESDLTGATNLIRHNNLQHSFSYYRNSDIKEQLSTFLPNIRGNIDAPGYEDNSSLRSAVEKPPICGKILWPLTRVQLSGFRLYAGRVPEQYNLFKQEPEQQMLMGQQSERHNLMSEQSQLHQSLKDTNSGNPQEQADKKRKRDDHKKEKKKDKKEKKKDKKEKKKDKKEKRQKLC